MKKLKIFEYTHLQSIHHQKVHLAFLYHFIAKVFQKNKLYIKISKQTKIEHKHIIKKT